MDQNTKELRDFNKLLLEIIALQRLQHELEAFNDDASEKLEMVKEAIQDKKKIKEETLKSVMGKHPQLGKYLWELGQFDA